VTIVACVNAAGERMSTLLVVKGKTERSVFGFNTTREAPSGTMGFPKKMFLNLLAINHSTS
jgi:hypothetical protein